MRFAIIPKGKTFEIKEIIESEIGSLDTGHANRVELKEHIDDRFNLERELTDSRLREIEKATIVAASSMEKRLDGMNEFRSTLKDQSARFITQESHNLLQDRTDKDLRELRDWKSGMEGKASQTTVNIAMIISVAGVLFGVVSLVLRFFGK